MAEIVRIPPSSPRRALRHALRRQSPGVEVLAEGFLAADSPIDLLARGASGELVAVRISLSDAPQETARLLTRGLSDIAWLRARSAGLTALASGLDLDIDAEPRALLVAPAFDPEILSATQSLPAHLIELMIWRGLRHRGQIQMVLEPALSTLPSSPQPVVHSRTAASPGARGETPDVLPPAPPPPSGFRTGLSDEDLEPGPSEADFH